MFEHRRDPRTSKPYSLANLLRTRAEREGWMLAVVGDATGFIMGSSRHTGDRQAARIAAHVAAELFPGGRHEIARDARSWPGVRLLATKLAVGVTVSILVDDRSRSRDLGDLASSVLRILSEPESNVLVGAAA